jgi:UDP-N-acetylmuramoylalanine--D-glutamate ligase
MSRLVVLGGGESGVGAAILAKEKGFDTFLSDMGAIPAKYKAELDSEKIAYEEGGHTYDLILNADEVVKSPGIPNEAPLIVELRRRGIPVISEIEFAGRYTDATMLCITGSNGKTTTTMLLYYILRLGGFNVGLAGNVGKSLARQVARCDFSHYVIELSSFQLDNMYDFRADIAILLNVTPDHLDRYDHKMENYTRAKFRITRNQRPGDSFIYWLGDPVIGKHFAEMREGEARLLPFYAGGDTLTGDASSCGACCVDDVVSVKDKSGATHTLSRAKLSLKGRHNLYNSMAAATAALMAEVPFSAVERGLYTFKAVEHRLETAGTIDGAVYVNDSKATNVDSTFYALESMTTPTILILGGKDKGNDYSRIAALVKEKVKAIVAMGVNNAPIIEFFNNDKFNIPFFDTHSLDEALLTCRKEACPGDTVLLSPACASFDLFHSYEDRGDQFKAWVLNHGGKA